MSDMLKDTIRVAPVSPCQTSAELAVNSRRGKTLRAVDTRIKA